jgi:hypothetical protein
MASQPSLAISDVVIIVDVLSFSTCVEVVSGYVIYCNFYDPFGNRLQICGPAPVV